MDLKINHRPSLAELQRWMKWIVTEPRGVDQALADQLGDPDTLQHFIKNQTPQTTADRLSIYAEAYFLRILESAKNDFPITFSILGDLNFQKMIADYLKVYPSRTSNIGGAVSRSFMPKASCSAPSTSAGFSIFMPT